MSAGTTLATALRPPLFEWDPLGLTIEYQISDINLLAPHRQYESDMAKTFIFKVIWRFWLDVMNVFVFKI